MVAGLCGRSEQLFFECERGHAEILEGIRFRTESAAMQRDGLDVRTLDLGPMGTAMLKTCRSWNVQTLLNQFGASRLVNFVTQRQIKSSSAVGLVISDSSDHLSVVLSGRVMERIWLVATKLGLSLQPLYAILPLIRYPTSRERFFSASQILAIERMVGDFRMLFGCSESNAQFLFRIGHGCTPKVRSLRKPLASFILTDERSGSSLTESCHNFEPIRTPLSDKLVNTAQLRIEPSEVS